MLLTEHVRVPRIEVAPVPPISNNTTAIPAVILIVTLFLSIFDTDSVNQKVEYKIYPYQFKVLEFYSKNILLNHSIRENK